MLRQWAQAHARQESGGLYWYEERLVPAEIANSRFLIVQPRLLEFAGSRNRQDMFLTFRSIHTRSVAVWAARRLWDGRWKVSF